MFSQSLADKGLNLQAVFNIEELPSELVAGLFSLVPECKHYRQLLLVAHGGTKLWQAMGDLKKRHQDPIDCYTQDQIMHYFAAEQAGVDFHIAYPGNAPIPLQGLGELAGWHFSSPFLVGINDEWGSWFAYRAVVLANTTFDTQAHLSGRGHGSPCVTCVDKACLTVCPAKAVSASDFNMQACIDYRKSDQSQCQSTCLARVACPIARTHRYSQEQLGYHYQRSLETIVKFY